MADKEIRLKAGSRKHAGFLRIVAVAIFFVTLLILGNNDYQFTLPLVSTTLISITLFIIGTLKSLEPPFSYVVTPEGITYLHKYGRWFIDWENISRIAQVQHTYGLDEQKLPYIGFRLNDIEAVLDKISPRLASRLVHEQRDIYIASLLQRDNLGELNALNLSPYKKQDGMNITGPIACWVHRTKELHQFLGFDIYVPISSFDIEPEEFVDLMKDCKRASINYQSP